jgi:hypothetical protein
VPNPIKYNASTETLALKKGNFWIGTGDVGKGPTNVTGYYNGITPPAGGFTIYLNKESNGPSIYVASNDAQLISLTNSIDGASYTTVNECLVYFAGQTDKVCVNRDYEGIVTDGLVLNLDAGFTPSYPRSGTTWYDVLDSNNGTLTNGPTFSSDNGGCIVFDGINDGCISDCPIDMRNDFSLSLFYYFDEYESNSADELGSVVGTNRPGGPNINRQQYLLATKRYWIGNSELNNGIWIGWGGSNTDNDSANMLISFQANSVTTNHIHREVTSTVYDWAQLCVTKNSSEIKIYRNGEYFNNIIINFTINTDSYLSGQLAIGGGSFGNYSKSKISIVNAYNRELTASEVLQNYNAQKSRFGL